MVFFQKTSYRVWSCFWLSPLDFSRRLCQAGTLPTTLGLICLCWVFDCCLHHTVSFVLPPLGSFWIFRLLHFVEGCIGRLCGGQSLSRVPLFKAFTSILSALIRLQNFYRSTSLCFDFFTELDRVCRDFIFLFQ